MRTTRQGPNARNALLFQLSKQNTSELGRYDVPRTSFTDSAIAPTIVSASETDKHRGGAKPMMSPCGMARRDHAALQQGAGDGRAQSCARHRRSVALPGPPRTPPRRAGPRRARRRHGHDCRGRRAWPCSKWAPVLPALSTRPSLSMSCEVCHAGRGANGMGRIGPAMADGAELVGAFFQNFPDVFRDD